MPPTTDAQKPSKAPKPAVALAKVTLHDKILELKVKLTGEAAVLFADYQRAYQVQHGEAVDQGVLASQMLAAFIDADRGFAAWRRANPESAA